MSFSKAKREIAEIGRRAKESQPKEPAARSAMGNSSKYRRLNPARNVNGKFK